MVYDVLSTGFSLVRTSLIFREGVYTIVGGSGNSFLSVLFCWISFQCFFMVCLLSLCASSQNWVTKASIFVMGFCLDRVSLTWLNLTDLMRLGFGLVCSLFQFVC